MTATLFLSGLMWDFSARRIVTLWAHLLFLRVDTVVKDKLVFNLVKTTGIVVQCTWSFLLC